MGWVVKATPLSLYSRERPGTHYCLGQLGNQNLDFFQNLRFLCTGLASANTVLTLEFIVGYNY